MKEKLGSIRVEFSTFRKKPQEWYYIREVFYNDKRVHYDIIPAKNFRNIDDQLQQFWKRYDMDNPLSYKKSQCACKGSDNACNHIGFFRKMRLKLLQRCDLLSKI